MTKMVFGDYATRDFEDNLVDKAAALAELYYDIQDPAWKQKIKKCYSELLSAHSVPEDDRYSFRGYVDLFNLNGNEDGPCFICESMSIAGLVTDSERGSNLLDCWDFALWRINAFGLSEYKNFEYKDFVLHNYVFDADPDLLVDIYDVECEYSYLFEDR